ncbi:MAG: hypothetical protein H5T83_12070, partial [Actinotalea sp.]|nr:hypothetical protein [Actinotalea sp.]
MHPSRLVAAASAWAAGVLYVLVGAGVLDIGRAVDPGAQDLLAFGIAAGVAQLLVGAVLLGARTEPLERRALVDVRRLDHELRGVERL